MKKNKNDGTRQFLKNTYRESVVENIEFTKGHKVGFWKGIFVGILIGILITIIISGSL